jgi:hypothetical protein
VACRRDEWAIAPVPTRWSSVSDRPVVGPFNRADLAPMDVGPRRDLRAPLDVSLAALLQPCFDLFKVPHDASRREIEAAREFAALLHLVKWWFRRAAR